MILIPVKNSQNAKQRLAAVLDQPARTALAQVMLHDVLDAVAACSCDAVAVVTSDEFALDLARQFAFEIIRDDDNRSETDAIQMATSWCLSRGVARTLVIPGDIPLIQASELDQILAAAPAQGSVLVPASDGRGTNAVLRTPADLFPLRFGNDSFKPHLHAARTTGLPCFILSLPGIGLDVDNPDDVRQLAAAGGDTRAQRLAREWDFSDYLLAANE
ncbi:MAG TPA: 2-phospho-L-lactate guanylyltransferase [Terriglobales bacterium]|nr:2-phospho-L-lactate guanylyltransferase [Terriglobales bacterium]